MRTLQHELVTLHIEELRRAAAARHTGRCPSRAAAAADPNLGAREARSLLAVRRSR